MDRELFTITKQTTMNIIQRIKMYLFGIKPKNPNGDALKPRGISATFVAESFMKKAVWNSEDYPNIQIVNDEK